MQNPKKWDKLGWKTGSFIFSFWFIMRAVEYAMRIFSSAVLASAVKSAERTQQQEEKGHENKRNAELMLCDILVEHFIEKFNAEQGRAVRGVSPAAMARLVRHTYTGNIRGLQNIIEHAYVVCRCDEIQEQCLPPCLAQDALAKPTAAPAVVADGALLPSARPVPNLRRLPPEALRGVIEQALEQAGGIRSLAAANLGIDPSTLWRKMKKLGMLDS